MRAADFERTTGKGKWLRDWKPEKRHLEVLFTTGQLMVRERRNFQRSMTWPSGHPRVA